MKNLNKKLYLEAKSVDSHLAVFEIKLAYIFVAENVQLLLQVTQNYI